MWIVSARFTWIPLYLLFAILIFRKYRQEVGKRYIVSLIIYLFAILAIVLSDQASNLVKNEVMRLRPSHLQGLMEHLHYYKDAGEDYMGSMYGFVSNHAANSASFTIFMVLLFRRRFVFFLLFSWMLLLCYSRVYLGVHYPSDVLGGIVLGAVTGFVAYKVCMLFLPQTPKGALKNYY